MSLRFYNTLTQKLEDFTPLHDNVVRAGFLISA